MRKRKIVGIDEAGRGPLAGPLSVGLVLIKDNKRVDFSGIRDSKKLTESNRERWFLKIKDWEKNGLIIRLALRRTKTSR
jgi:ribonuclease HII